MEKSEIAAVRQTIFARQNGHCLWCDKPLTPDQAHMHEKVFRSHGGEISLENSIILCYACHFGNKNAHGGRHPQFSKKVLDKPPAVCYDGFSRTNGGNTMFDIKTFDVEKFDSILACGLSHGLGKRGGQVCIEAAICQTLGLPHGDDPQCVSESVRTFKISLNDSS